MSNLLELTETNFDEKTAKLLTPREILIFKKSMPIWHGFDDKERAVFPKTVKWR